MAFLLWKNYILKKAVKISIGIRIDSSMTRTLLYFSINEIHFVSIQRDSYVGV